MDVVKLVLVIVLIVMAVLTFGIGLTSLQNGSDAGRDAVSDLDTVRTEPAGGVSAGETPVTLARSFLQSLTGVDLASLLVTTVAGIVAVVIAIYAWRLARSILGG